MSVLLKFWCFVAVLIICFISAMNAGHEVLGLAIFVIIGIGTPLFRCPRCKTMIVRQSPMGYTYFGLPGLRCSKCNAEL